MSWLTSGIYRMRFDDSSNASQLFLTHNFSLYNIQEKELPQVTLCGSPVFIVP